LHISQPEPFITGPDRPPAPLLFCDRRQALRHLIHTTLLQLGQYSQWSVTGFDALAGIDLREPVVIQPALTLIFIQYRIKNIRLNLALPQLDRELIPAVLPAGQQAQRYRTSLVFRIVMFLIFSHTGPFRDDLQNDRLSVPGLPRKHTTRNQTLDRAGRRRYSAATANWLQSQGYRFWLHSFRNCSRTAKPSHSKARRHPKNHKATSQPKKTTDSSYASSRNASLAPALNNRHSQRWPSKV